MSFWRNHSEKSAQIITLSGIKGGLSLALAMAIPEDIVNYKEIILMIYSVVVFTLIVQSLFVHYYVSKLKNRPFLHLS